MLRPASQLGPCPEGLSGPPGPCDAARPAGVACLALPWADGFGEREAAALRLAGVPLCPGAGGAKAFLPAGRERRLAALLRARGADPAPEGWDPGELRAALLAFVSLALGSCAQGGGVLAGRGWALRLGEDGFRPWCPPGGPRAVLLPGLEPVAESAPLDAADCETLGLDPGRYACRGVLLYAAAPGALGRPLLVRTRAGDSVVPEAAVVDGGADGVPLAAAERADELLANWEKHLPADLQGAWEGALRELDEFWPPLCVGARAGAPRAPLGLPAPPRRRATVDGPPLAEVLRAGLALRKAGVEIAGTSAATAEATAETTAKAVTEATSVHPSRPPSPSPPPTAPGPAGGALRAELAAILARRPQPLRPPASPPPSSEERTLSLSPSPSGSEGSEGADESGDPGGPDLGWEESPGSPAEGGGDWESRTLSLSPSPRSLSPSLSRSPSRSPPPAPRSPARTRRVRFAPSATLVEPDGSVRAVTLDGAPKPLLQRGVEVSARAAKTADGVPGRGDGSGPHRG